jgi:hypothetical protein
MIADGAETQASVSEWKIKALKRQADLLKEMHEMS